jgi:hypothetical protein
MMTISVQDNLSAQLSTNVLASIQQIATIVDNKRIAFVMEACGRDVEAE